MIEGANARALAALLAPARGRLYLLLDSARTPRVLTLLREAGDEHVSLYDGPRGLSLSPWGPFLVAAPHDGRLTFNVLKEGWSQSWGIFVHSTASLENLRRHFRRFQIVTNEAGKRYYFRFYDPRVSREFLSMATPRQATTVFDEVDSYWMESEAGDAALSFCPKEGGRVHQTVVPLAGDG